MALATIHTFRIQADDTRIPPDATLTIDLRHILPDPGLSTEHHAMTGQEAAVRQRVMSAFGAAALIAGLTNTITGLLRNGRSLDVWIGCGTGRTSSIAVAEEIAARIRLDGCQAATDHTGLTRGTAR